MSVFHAASAFPAVDHDAAASRSPRWHERPLWCLYEVRHGRTVTYVGITTNALQRARQHVKSGTLRPGGRLVPRVIGSFKYVAALEARRVKWGRQHGEPLENWKANQQQRLRPEGVTAMTPIPAPEPEAPHASPEVTGVTNAVCDLDHPVVTFTAYRRGTGERIVVDDRTFDGATMSLDPVEPPA